MNINGTNQKIPYRYLLWGGIGLYIAGISYLSILRMESFSANVYDLGIMIQTVWNTSNGWILQESVNMGVPMMRFWMAHWEFIYIPIAFIYKIFPSPYTILILQTLVVSSGALPIYWLAKERLNNERIALIFSSGYLLYPAIQNANLNDIHGVTFAAPFLMFAFYYLQKRKISLFAIFAGLAIISREDSALILFMMGLYAAFILKEKKLGAIVALTGFLWFFVWYERMAIRSMLGLPAFAIMEGAEAHWDHLSNVAHDPFYLFTFLAKKHNIRYFFYIFGPVALLSFFSLKTLLIATPIFVINLLSSYYYTHDVEHHYSATIAPFIYVSAIYGAQNLLGYFKDKSKIKSRLTYLSIVVFLCALVFFFLKSNVFDVKKWQITDHHRIIKRVMTQIPQEASLSAELKLAVHTAERHELYVFNDNVDKVDYILYDFYSPTVNLVDRKTFHLPFFWPDNDSIRKVLWDSSYGVIEYQDGVCLLKKGAAYQDGLKKITLASADEIINHLNIEIAPNIYCSGYNLHEVLEYYYALERLGGIYWKKALHVTLYWKSLIDNPENFELLFKIQNGNQEMFRQHVPVFGLYPSSKWKANEFIRDEVFWELPDTMTPGIYQIAINMSSNNESKNFIPLFYFEIK